jgi:pyridoxal 5'-phosphate synthase pdxS subunit
LNLVGGLASAAFLLLLLVLLQAVTHYNNGKVLADVSCNLGEPMVGIDVREKGFSSYANRSE